ncbi:uncharacterized protein LOC126956208 [Macaca thibetana thibetana]|uniref:uncharacterized protein LOC126956208 n=1 Tax=Macaca thibetana thibetana TaxID=257877 RepID=UPI0021BC8C6F|nr:uncharacterized protein LOC126956208 [Macaca thibetana thibetana]
MHGPKDQNQLAPRPSQPVPSPWHCRLTPFPRPLEGGAAPETHSRRLSQGPSTSSPGPCPDPVLTLCVFLGKAGTERFQRNVALCSRVLDFPVVQIYFFLTLCFFFLPSAGETLSEYFPGRTDLKAARGTRRERAEREERLDGACAWRPRVPEAGGTRPSLWAVSGPLSGRLRGDSGPAPGRAGCDRPKCGRPRLHPRRGPWMPEGGFAGNSQDPVLHQTRSVQRRVPKKRSVASRGSLILSQTPGKQTRQTQPCHTEEHWLGVLKNSPQFEFVISSCLDQSHVSVPRNWPKPHALLSVHSSDSRARCFASL